MNAKADSLATIPVTALRGVGPRRAQQLARLGIDTVQDLLFHLPLRYQDRTRVVPVGSLRAGDQAVIEVTVDHAEVRFGRRRSLLVRVSDGSGALMLRFFHFTAAQKQAFARGVRLRCFGEARNGPAMLELVHPEYTLLRDDAPAPVEEALTPIYPTTEGLHQLSWRDLTGQALALLHEGRALQELLPEAVLREHRLPSLPEAVALLHRPPPDVSTQLLSENGHPAQQRLAFEELLAHQLSLRMLRRRARAHAAPRVIVAGELERRLLDTLPFEPTGAQRRVAEEIAGDLASGRPMLRLVQGDVGSGKTLVAALAAARALEDGWQVALMAPTELLAEQHRQNLAQWFAPLGIEVGWLTGRHKGRRRAAVLEHLAAGELALVVGSHALFQEDVRFARLGLAIVDEQHRFGVHQRLALRNKGDGLVPHQLIMTATPIPRTLAMTAYADLDLSVIDELPPGRQPVKTVVISDERRSEVVARVGENCRQGRQAYWACTLIEESEALQCQAAEDTARELAEALPDLRVGLVHGRLKDADKEGVMQAFKAGELDLLVATTVIEVGVDVPNASLMIIENAERLGLAQLHQLRGRVGRGAAESHCVLMYHPPLGQLARERLGMLRESSDGFAIARKDLALRGPGEVLGTRQTGEVQFRIADLVRDEALIPQVQALADRLLREHPELAAPLIRRWLGEKVHYAAV
ncbi:ATP-dependent DNA helicase RecG [endosymbiont of unidentified scaly snail isolate Monju]|uniref:ATP-dependent DNA helicase RecG n=1 Tax=endosymbiont of unidentified scaly snail isolate Monju TaxID=1248727 RepID=UPI0005B97B14|nr:ATP-dependent DNA helicase RecG [endosymbiont of unidentified scaly snail isolate Monju]